MVEAFSAYTSYGDRLGALEKLKPRVSENAIKTTIRSRTDSEALARGEASSPPLVSANKGSCLPVDGDTLARRLVETGTIGRTVMAGLFDNPMGADGFEFIEDTAPDVAGLRAVFESIEFDQIRRGVLEG